MVLFSVFHILLSDFVLSLHLGDNNMYIQKFHLLRYMFRLMVVVKSQIRAL